MDSSLVRLFYKEHEMKPFYERLVMWMSRLNVFLFSAPIYAIVLEKEDAIKSWRTLAGPTNSILARQIAPKSIRARFGTNGIKRVILRFC